MQKSTGSNFRASFLFRDPRGRVIFWVALLAAVWYATYALHLWDPLAGRGGFSFLSGSPTRGGALFSSLGCNACHGLYGVGPKLGPDLGTSLPSGSSPVRIIADMWNHSPQMWEKMRDAQLGFPRISEQDMLDLLAYLYVVRYLNVPGNADRGEELFSSKGCVQCHTLGSRSGGPGPDLSQFHAATPILWAQRMWNHGYRMKTLLEEKKTPWPTFEGDEMLDLLTFVQTKSTGKRQESSLLPARPDLGKSLFVQKGCSTCHAVDGVGSQAGPDLGSQHAVPPSIVQFAGLMWNHFPQMFAEMGTKGMTPPQFAEREMADLIAYLYLVGYLEPAGRVDLGVQVFHKKHCSNCHGAEGRGGRGGPNLARRRPYYASQLGYSVWTHGPQMYRRMREQNIAWPTLDEKELIDLVAFLNSL